MKVLPPSLGTMLITAVGVAVGRDPARGEHRFLRGFLVLVVAAGSRSHGGSPMPSKVTLVPILPWYGADLPGVAAGDVEAFVALETRGERHESYSGSSRCSAAH